MSQILRICKVNHPYHDKVSKRKEKRKFSQILRAKKVKKKKKKKEYNKMKNQIIIALVHNSRHKNRKRRKN